MAFDLVIFDCDGVLVDSELLSVRADLACLAEYGIALTADDLIERYTGISLAGMVADLERRFGRRLTGFEHRHQPLLRAIFEAELRPIRGVEDVLDSLPGKVCVASSGTPERIRHALSKVGLFDRLYPHLFSATMVAHGKPAPDLFRFAAVEMGVMPGECVVIEDSLAGVSAAAAAGMAAIGFVGGSHCRTGDADRLAGAGAAIVIDDMAELLPALARLRP